VSLYRFLLGWVITHGLSVAIRSWSGSLHDLASAAGYPTGARLAAGGFPCLLRGGPPRYCARQLTAPFQASTRPRWALSAHEREILALGAPRVGEPGPIWLTIEQHNGLNFASADKARGWEIRRHRDGCTHRRPRRLVENVIAQRCGQRASPALARRPGGSATTLGTSTKAT
jgi:hypothetical protein